VFPEKPSFFERVFDDFMYVLHVSQHVSFTSELFKTYITGWFLSHFSSLGGVTRASLYYTSSLYIVGPRS